MSENLLKHLHILRMISEWPRTITTTKVKIRLENMNFKKQEIRTIQRNPEDLSEPVRCPKCISEKSKKWFLQHENEHWNHHYFEHYSPDVLYSITMGGLSG